MNFIKVSSADLIQDIVYFENLEKGGVRIEYDIEKYDPNSKFKKMHLFINPSNETIYYNSEVYLRLLLSDVGYAEMESLNVINLAIPGFSIQLFGEVK